MISSQARPSAASGSSNDRMYLAGRSIRRSNDDVVMSVSPTKSKINRCPFNDGAGLISFSEGIFYVHKPPQSGSIVALSSIISRVISRTMIVYLISSGVRAYFLMRNAYPAEHLHAYRGERCEVDCDEGGLFEEIILTLSRCAFSIIIWIISVLRVETKILLTKLS